MLLKTTKVFDRITSNHTNRIQVLQGSTASSKTFSILQYLISIALSSPTKQLISVVTETYPASRRGVQRDFFNILGDTYSEKYHNKTEGIYQINDSLIEFFSADQPDKLRGPRRDFLFVNEANNINYESYTQLEIRTNNKVFLDYNPTNEFWAHEYLIGKEGVSFDISTYKDNPYLSKQIVKSIESRKYNHDGSISEWFKVYGLGMLGKLEGCVYEFEQIEGMPDFGVCVYGLDFGFSNDPSCLVRCIVTNEDIYVEELLYERQLTNQDIAAKLKILGIRPGKDIIYCDSSEPKSIEEISRRGFTVKPSIKGKDSIVAGIDYVKQHRLKVTKGSTNLIKELRNYRWAKDKNGKSLNIPIDEWNHGMDGIRYACSSKLKPANKIKSKKLYL